MSANSCDQKYVKPSGLARGGDCSVAIPPNRLIEWTFYEKLSFYGLFCGPQICQKCISGWRSTPDTAGGAHDAPPDPLVGWGGGHPSPFPTSSAPQFSHLRHFDPRAAPVEAWCPPPTALELATVLARDGEDYKRKKRQGQSNNSFWMRG